MPSETPRLPRETHRSLLSRDANRGLPLQAGEIATFDRPKTNVVRQVLFCCAIVALICMAYGIGAS